MIGDNRIQVAIIVRRTPIEVLVEQSLAQIIVHDIDDFPHLQAAINRQTSATRCAHRHQVDAAMRRIRIPPQIRALLPAYGGFGFAVSM
jgi:hypothetical protein